MISPASIVTTPAFGLPVMMGYINPTSIVTTPAFGLPSRAGSISPASIVTTPVFGSPTILAATTRAFTIFIGGVDRTRYVKDPSISYSAQIGATRTATFVVIPKDGISYIPEPADEVIIHYNRTGHRLFGGEIVSTGHKRYTGSSGQYEVAINCTGYGVVLERRAVAKFYTEFLGNEMAIITLDLTRTALLGTDITYNYFGGDFVAGMALGEQLFNWITCREAMDQMAAKAQLEWLVTNYKEVKLMTRGSGYTAAPYSIVEGNGKWKSMLATRTLGKFWNRAIVRNSQDVVALWTDTISGNGDHGYATTYPQEVKPVVKFNTVAEIVCEKDARGSTVGWQWFYIAGGPGIFRNPALSAPTGSDAIEVIHPSRVSSVFIAQDDASIAAVGLCEHIEEVKDITSEGAGQAAAAGVLAKGMEAARNLNIVSQEAGWEPGQLVTVATAEVNGTFLIDSVNMAESQRSFPEWTIQASNASTRNGSATTFFQKVVSNQRQALDRVGYGFGFTLAETVQGYTNPGLTTGAPISALYVIPKDGVLKYCRLDFGSVIAGTLTTQAIEIDVLKNGVSIFAAPTSPITTGTCMMFPAGATAGQTRFLFLTNPMPVAEGDRITINVISADPLATDGYLGFQVMG